MVRGEESISQAPTSRSQDLGVRDASADHGTYKRHLALLEMLNFVKADGVRCELRGPLSFISVVDLVLTIFLSSSS